MAVITKWQLLRLNAKALGRLHRASLCLRYRIPQKEVQIIKPAGASPRYRHLMPCNSVWACPVCTLNIARGRADEIRHAVKKWHELGGKTAMITYTMRHTKKTSLSANIKLMKDSYANMLAHRTYRRLRVWEHQIQSFEITWGQNGWHTHYHTIIFYKGRLNHAELESALGDLWGKYVITKKKWGVRVTNPPKEKIGNYASKWGEAGEIAGGDEKRGAGETYLDLLLTGQYSLVREYATATAGRNKITWSQGSKFFFGIAEIKDSVLAKDMAQDEPFLTIPSDVWAAISVKNNDLRELLLEWAGKADTEGDFYDIMLSELGVWNE